MTTIHLFGIVASVVAASAVASVVEPADNKDSCQVDMAEVDLMQRTLSLNDLHQHSKGRMKANQTDKVSADAVNLCSLHEEMCDIRSFSGFVPIPHVGSLFYWYFEGPDRDGKIQGGEERPFILWLQGGPGASSMMGTFFETGPVTVDDANVLRRRSNYDTWVSEYSMLYVDSPVGTGWSFADEGGYAKSEHDVTLALASFLERFSLLHPEAPKSIVLAGESYAGHFLPPLAKHILSQKDAPFKLHAMLIGDSFLDPGVEVLTKPQDAFSFGLLDEKQLAAATALAQEAADHVQKEEWVEAATARYALDDLVHNVSGINLMDVRTTQSYAWQEVRMQGFFNQNSTKDLLHIPRDRSFGTSPLVAQNLKADIMRSYRDCVEFALARDVPLLFFQGQFDWLDGVAANEAWIRSMKWGGIPGYLNATRTIWRRESDGEIAGYWRHYRNLHQVVVRDAGHMVAMNQPQSALDMLVRFLKNM